MNPGRCGIRNKITKSNFDKPESIEESSSPRKGRSAAMSSLAEAIILQSIEDLWLEKEQSDCLNFFTGESFHICAKLSGMDFRDRVGLLALVKNISGKLLGSRHDKTRDGKVKKYIFPEEETVV